MLERRARPLTHAELEPVLAPLERARPLPARAFVDDDVFAFEQDGDLRAVVDLRRARRRGRAARTVAPRDRRRRADPRRPRRRSSTARVLRRLPSSRRVARRTRERAARRALRVPVPRLDLRARRARSRAPRRAARASIERRMVSARSRVDEWRRLRLRHARRRRAAARRRGSARRRRGSTDGVLGSLRSAARRTTYEVARELEAPASRTSRSRTTSRACTARSSGSRQRATRARGSTSGPWLGGTMEIAATRRRCRRDGARHGRPLARPPEHRAATRVSTRCSSRAPHEPPARLPPHLSPRRRSPRPHARRSPTSTSTPRRSSPSFDPRDVFDFWDRVNAEDRAICEDQQAERRSRAFAPALLRDGRRRHARVRSDGRRVRRIARGAHRDEPPLRDLGPPVRRSRRRCSTPRRSTSSTRRSSARSRASRPRTRAGASSGWASSRRGSMDDPYVDAMHVIERFSTRGARALRLVRPTSPTASIPTSRETIAFGDETDHPLTRAQMR